MCTGVGSATGPWETIMILYCSFRPCAIPPLNQSGVKQASQPLFSLPMCSHYFLLMWQVSGNTNMNSAARSQMYFTLRENSFSAFHPLIPEGRRKRSCPEEGRLLEPGGFECSMRLCRAGGGGGGRDGGRASKASSPAFKERSLSTVELH